MREPRESCAKGYLLGLRNAALRLHSTVESTKLDTLTDAGGGEKVVVVGGGGGAAGGGGEKVSTALSGLPTDLYQRVVDMERALVMMLRLPRESYLSYLSPSSHTSLLALIPLS